MRDKTGLRTEIELIGSAGQGNFTEREWEYPQKVADLRSDGTSPGSPAVTTGDCRVDPVRVRYGMVYLHTTRCGLVCALLLTALIALVAPAGAIWTTQAVDSSGNVGAYSSLALDTSGNPHISYFDHLNYDLKYAAWTGTGWEIETVDSSGNVGECSSLALDSAGNPHIGYRDYSNFDLKYAEGTLIPAFSASPVSGSAPLTVTFTDTTADTTTSWFWNFGDGNTSFTQNPSYTYTTPGTYTVTLYAANGVFTNATSVRDSVTVTGSGGAATAIAVDPVTGSNVYAGVENQGVYRSTNNGGSWTSATTQPDNTEIRALVINPLTPTTLYTGTYGGGVYRSTDSGDHWTACSNTGLADLNVLSLVSNSTGGLYAGTENGVYSSTDCDSWTTINIGLP